MPELLTYRGVVYPWQCDQMGHLNVAFYVAKFDEATWQLFFAVGLAPSRLRSAGRGMAGLEQHIEYKRELRPGDVISIRSRVLEVRAKTIRFLHEMQNDETGEVSATTTLTAVFMDTNERKSCPLPEDVLERARAKIDG